MSSDKSYINLESYAVIDRLKEFLNVDSDSKLSKLLNIPSTTLSTWRTKNTNIDYRSIVKKLHEISDREINLEWLLTGKGEMFKHTGNYLTKSNLSKTVNFIQVGAGNPVVKFDMKEAIDNIPVPKELLDKRVIPARVSGDSMYPKLKEGTIVLIDTREKEIISGEIYCLNMPDEGLIVKRLFKVPNKIIVRSDNRKYPEFELTYDELNSYNLPIVIGRIRFIAEFRK